MGRTRCVVCGRFMSAEIQNAFVLLQPGRSGLVCCMGNSGSGHVYPRITSIQEHHGRHRRIGFRHPDTSKEVGDE